MKYVVNLLREEVDDLRRRVYKVIDLKYEVQRRGKAPAGATWNTDVDSELSRLDTVQDEYEASIGQCVSALLTIEGHK